MSCCTDDIVWKEKARREKSKNYRSKIRDLFWPHFVVTACIFFEFSPFWPHFVVTACIQNATEGKRMFSQITFRLHFPKNNLSSF